MLKKNEYEKINCLSCCDIRLTSNSRLRRGAHSSSKEVISPAPVPPPPPEYFRRNEFDIGAFGTYATGLNSNNGIHGWGGGIDLTYWFPWKYAGVGFQGAGWISEEVAVHEFTLSRVSEPVTVTGGGTVSRRYPDGRLLLRLPLDSFWPNFHLAPYSSPASAALSLAAAGGMGERSVRPLL